MAQAVLYSEEMDRPICINQFVHAGLPCIVVQIMVGPEHSYLCASVGISKRHPHFKKQIKDMLDLKVSTASNNQPVFGTTPEMWWIGFDQDLDESEPDLSAFEKRCRMLAEQLASYNRFSHN